MEAAADEPMAIQARGPRASGRQSLDDSTVGDTATLAGLADAPEFIGQAAEIAELGFDCRQMRACDLVDLVTVALALTRQA